MALQKYQPQGNVPRDLIKDFFNDEMFFAPFFRASAVNRGIENWAPALDVSEDDHQFILNVDLPGLKKENVRLSFENGILTLEGERRQEEEHRDKNYHRIERSYGKFVRSLNLGPGVDPQNIKASYKDGVLTVTVPKSEKAKPKTIDINVG